MSIVADTHVHVYGCHDAGSLLTAAARNLAAIATDPGASKVLFLTERRDCRFFASLSAGETAISVGPWVPQSSPEPGSLLLERPAGDALWLVAGRQIATRERLEILALTADVQIPDGLPIAETVETVLAAGAVPVLAWAPGKWWFARGRIVDRTLARFGRALLLGDSTLRPLGWMMPGPMRRRTLLAGSDPLPFPGEEGKAGGYGILFDCDLSPDRPVTDLRRLLTGEPPPRVVGRRDGPLEVLRRLRRHRGGRR
jgi:hypothetical protein